MATTGLLIGDSWRNSSAGPRITVINPATEEDLTTLPSATAADLDDALKAAHAGFHVWRQESAWARARVLHRIAALISERAGELAHTLTLEQGKPLPEAKAELQAAAEQFEWYAEEARRTYGQVIPGHSIRQRLIVMLQPVGPVAAFTPWNFPALLPARKLAAAFAAGCSVILKPAEECPLIAMAMAGICLEAGLPPGVLNLVVGDPAAISSHLIASPVIRKVSLTGSVRVGQLLAHQAAEGLKRVTMELGGHAPLIVFEDADVEEAAVLSAKGKFRNNGQVCIATSRIFVQQSVYDRFLDTFLKTVNGFTLGSGMEAGVDIGPMASERGLSQAARLVEDAAAQGAKVLAGGCRSKKFNKGYFFEPAVLTEVKDSMEIMRREPFGPVVPVATFETFDEVIQRANNTDYGLAGYVFTRSTDLAFNASEALEVGMVGVNNLLIATAEIPFGGVKMSGYGREGGSYGIHDYLEIKYINLQL